jgi:WD40 repeat protein
MTGMAAYAPNNKIVAVSGFTNCGIMLLDAITGKELRKLKDFSLADRYVFSPDSKQLIVDSCLDVRVFEVDTGRELAPLIASPGEGRGTGVAGLAFSPDRKILGTNSVDQLDRSRRTVEPASPLGR